jgi:hypothetical protein
LPGPNESVAIARKPEVGYCVVIGDACRYAADNHEFDEGEPEKVVLVDDGYLVCPQRSRGHGSRWQRSGWPAYLVGRWMLSGERLGSAGAQHSSGPATVWRPDS